MAKLNLWRVNDRVAALERRVEQLERAAAPLKWDDFQPVRKSCPTCGHMWEGAMGYVCPNLECPVQLKSRC